ncbi:hypothetical protein ACHAXS_005208, partial [Conticribra weissflogii]
ARRPSSPPSFLPTPHHRHLRYHAHAHAHANRAEDDHGDNPTISRDEDDIRISFQLHDPSLVPLKHEVNYYHCDEPGRMPLPESLRRVDPVVASPNNDSNNDSSTSGGRILSFTATASTSLKLLHIGDSVADQFADSLGEMLGAPQLQSRRVLGNGPDNLVSPTRGGGVSATMRITELLARKNEGKPSENNAAGGGWSAEQVERFLKHPRETGENATTTTVVGRFDAAVVRVMHGWMTPEEITKERLIEAIRMSNEVFGAQTVVLMTVPFTNSVKSIYDYHAVQLVNREIRNIADAWHETFRYENGNDEKGGGVRHVLLLDFDTYCNHVIWSNAIHLGYNVSEPLHAGESTFDEEIETFLFDRLKTGKKYPPSIAMVCDSRELVVRDSQCKHYNMLWRDGMHICPETMTSRYGAALACLLGCVFNGRVVEGRDDDAIKDCERECNRQFMSVMPVDDAWVDRNVTLASFGNTLHSD